MKRSNFSPGLRTNEEQCSYSTIGLIGVGNHRSGKKEVTGSSGSSAVAASSRSAQHLDLPIGSGTT